MAVECLRVLLVRPHVAPETAGELARQTEDTGWHGGWLPDSQHLQPDVWVTVGHAIAATTTLKIATGVTNPATRDAAVTASAAAGSQWLSGGRFVLGIGRGDSAVHKLGRHPVGVTDFGGYIAKVQSYLRGEPANTDTDGGPCPLWVSRIDMPKTPMDVSATGPKVIALGAEHAEHVSFSVGSDPARVGWAIDQAHAACTDLGRDPATLSLGAYVQVVVDEDRDRGRDLARGLAAVHHRFSAMNTDIPLAALSGQDLEMAGKVSAAYRASGHGLGESEQAKALDAEFLDRFAIIGPAGYCVERLLALVELGIERFWVLPPANDSEPEAMHTVYGRFAEEVLPHLP